MVGAVANWGDCALACFSSPPISFCLVYALALDLMPHCTSNGDFSCCACNGTRWGCGGPRRVACLLMWTPPPCSSLRVASLSSFDSVLTHYLYPCPAETASTIVHTCVYKIYRYSRSLFRVVGNGSSATGFGFDYGFSTFLLKTV